MPSNTKRFEVFKRDSFTCQYCGRTPPEVVLEVDHVIPKFQNGKDDVNNFITACFDCNRGKGKRLLTTLPTPLNKLINDLKEQRMQLVEYNLLLENIEKETKSSIKRINNVFKNKTNKCYEFSDIFKKNTLRTFLKSIPEENITQALYKSIDKHSPNYLRALKYFCGICWNWIKYPETREW